MTASAVVLGLLLATVPYTFFTCRTWAGALMSQRSDASTVKRWQIQAFTAIGAFQILTTAALYVGARSPGVILFAPALMGVAMIVLPRVTPRLAAAAGGQEREEQGEKDDREDADDEAALKVHV